ncbi:ankyrin repeat, SAM and basic leucine zipper domain-containing protein 1 isoform X1 [Astyanax mexicanus]|uniref:Ankyrin repeat, SAM and basic leucine zipper domain-containing protein 1 n=1 Tax=Astyanax mexicanus TaxID=7994 RepID=A0A8B9R8Q5_ASTMX|nr:ankyrin repeat, SAM and basic leucine zipper domain-containing protein 1 isoform X1 [Astyanax mexicanus]
MIDYGFPAGDESDGSNDEWDTGYTSGSKSPNSEVSGSTLPSDDNVSVLKRAISAGDVNLVQQLLESGMDVETRLGFGWTPLMCAVHVSNYTLTQLLLDHGASANFSRDDYTVLMAACTANSTTEEKIAKCVALLLNRNADPNIYTRSRMTCLMLAARDNYSHLINLLVSHGAELDFQDDSGHTALMLAVQYGHEGAVLKLLQLGADKSIKTKAGKTAADLAKTWKHTQLYKILNSPRDHTTNGGLPSKAETVFKFLNSNLEAPSVSKESSAKLCDIELLLHGLNLEHLSDVMMDNDISWSYLLTMEKADLEKIGITDPEDLKKVLNAVQEIHSDRVDVDTLSKLENIDSGSEELLNFLISLRQQCCYLSEAVQDVISRFPHSPSELVLTLDPKKEAQAICTELVAQTGDLQKQVTCLKDLLSKMDPTDNFLQLPLPSPPTSKRRRVLNNLTLGLLGTAAAALLLLSTKFKNYS